MGPLLCSRSFRFFLIVVWLCFTDVVFAQDQTPPDAGQSLLNTYPYNQSWSSPEKKNSKTKAPQSPVYQETPKSEPTSAPPPPAPTPAPAAVEATAPATPAGPSDGMPVMPVPSLTKPVVAKNEISAAGDFLYGSGRVTVPIGYSLNKSLGGLATVKGTPNTVDRNSDYLGGTVSYSFLHAWYLDLSYDHGNSSGTVPIESGFLGHVNSSFTIDDNWYQAYIRYAFPALRGKRLSAYLRAGVSYVEADLKMNVTKPESLYTQNDHTTDILGNGGFGLGYSLYASRRWIIGLQVEGEGFFGSRSQKSKETLPLDAGLTPVEVGIDNTLYGGIGRGTIRFEYRLGQTSQFRIFAEGGAQGKFTEITYPGAGNSSELLWGPYVKLGLRYSF